MRELDEWRDRPACRNHPNPDMWFPTTRKQTAESAEAKRICVESCPVRWKCANDADRSGVRYGINAGFDTGTSEGWKELQKFLGRRPATQVRRQTRPVLCTQCGEEFHATRVGSAPRCMACVHGLVPVKPVHDHLKRIQRETGWICKEIAARAGLSRSAVQATMNQRNTYMKRETAERLLAVRADSLAATA